MQKQKTESRVAVYYELTKPKIWYLLVFTAFGAALTASNIYGIEIAPSTWALMLFSVAAGSAAANTLTNYHDRDIDAIMERTKGRPLPSKRIYPAVKARNFGLVLAGISLVLAFGISFTTTLEQGLWATAFIAFGLLNNILVYSYALKRNSRTNIILGGLCGGSPPMIGWVAVTMSDLWTMGLAMAGLVFIWIPMHIWALTLHFKDDYNKVNVPMLTAVQSEKTSARAIAGSTVVMVLFSIAPFFITTQSGEEMVGGVYLWTAIASGALMVALSIWVIVKPMEKASWTLFKFSSPYLAVLFIALMVDSAL
ncbi:Protoheme IX farnesyltransferase 2 protein [Marine Group I thaumarchaeote SCGC AAA799-E16]|uniref:Protoheme IX farnesyltransferase n=4 Tax=Marine Group I TaxID=905826 RepID=A0A087RYF7_9ARCH|nr:Protoheme IX farnesyltransferase 2 protein [Marine Group I thaumarchaeote SCGC AAA799-E16]KFM14813.1 Protoheme IX farnesyltransferase 2 protein [Marine Group I thaumarchaeote SCGC AAA799-D11]KFM17568.1 Protoheme IX farnesyltransferase 2 protein [Marine Group I thaumarchaeote SCGC RSA3]KFM18511.1 Protoheme IX farnesyltransferase 2 protein [Marine Group I thaumarchaeote SCGC AAA799-P11]